MTPTVIQTAPRAINQTTIPKVPPLTVIPRPPMISFSQQQTQLRKPSPPLQQTHKQQFRKQLQQTRKQIPSVNLKNKVLITPIPLNDGFNTESGRQKQCRHL
jgi:hypothetical protein